MYKYFGTKHAHELKACEKCEAVSWIRKAARFCSNSCAKSGSNSPGWMGDSVGYRAAHARVYRARGVASSCVFGSEDEHTAPFNWANLTGNYPDIDDYAQMCRSCHSFFDNAVAKCFDKTCKRGHVLNDKTMNIRTNAAGRQRRQCKKCESILQADRWARRHAK